MFLCLLWCECYEENYLSFTCLNNFANDSKKKIETYKVPFWLFIICLHILSVSSGWFLFQDRKLHFHMPNAIGFHISWTSSQLQK